MERAWFVAILLLGCEASDPDSGTTSDRSPDAATPATVGTEAPPPEDDDPAPPLDEPIAPNPPENAIPDASPSVPSPVADLDAGVVPVDPGPGPGDVDASVPGITPALDAGPAPEPILDSGTIDEDAGVPPAVDAEWRAPVMVAEGADASTAFDAAGTVAIAAWNEQGALDGGSVQRVYAAVWETGSLGPKTLLSVDAQGSAHSPLSALSADGSFGMVVWEEAEALAPVGSDVPIRLMSASWDGEVWSTPAVIASGLEGSPSEPDFELSADGDVAVLTWVQPVPDGDTADPPKLSRLLAADWSDGTWSLPVELSSEDSLASRYPDVALSADGNTRLLAWNRNYPGDPDTGSSGTTQLFTVEWTGNGWTSPERRSQAGANTYYVAPSIELSASGDVAVAVWSVLGTFEPESSESGARIFGAKRTGGTWSDPVHIAGALWANNAVVSLSADGAVATVSWLQPGPGIPDQVFATRWVDAPSAPVWLSSGTDGDVHTGAMASSADGSAVLVAWHQFEDLDGDPETTTRSRVYGSSWREDAWSPPELLSDNMGGSAYSTNAVVSPDGQRAALSLYYNIEVDVIGTRLATYE